MKNKKELVISVLATFCLAATLFMIVPTKSQSGNSYDPWTDVNDDGTIDMADISMGIDGFMTSGTSINKTDVLLDLQNRTIRFYEPSTTVVESSSEWIDAATFVWTPENPTDNAILSVSCYFQLLCLWGGGSQFRIVVNDAFDAPGFIELGYSPAYAPSRVYTDGYLAYYGLAMRFPNQSGYTFRVQFTGVLQVKDINVLLEVVDGLPPN